MRLFIFTLIFCGLAACQPSATSSNSSSSEAPVAAYQAPSHHVALLTSVFDAHGGYEQWSSMKTLSYSKGEEETITNLENRKIRVSDADRTIGFDGNEVWISPDTSRARFYHNLYFYFYAMPFVVGDPGAFYEEVPSREIQGKTYRGIKISYREGVGDASDDNYILWVDPETYQMEWLMYTVTYRSQEPSDDYRLIKYDGWQTFNGVKLPTSLQWYNFDGETVGDPRGDGTRFEDVQLAKEAPADSLFDMPSNAIVAPR